MNKKTLISILILFFTTLSTFIYTVNIRKPWFGELSQEGYYDTAVTVLFVKNWIREGPLRLKFGMFWHPKSVEFKDFVDRDYYRSVPPGTLIPIYILGKLFANKSLVVITMVYNLFNHFLIAFFLSMIVFFFLVNLLDTDRLSATIFSFIPIFLELLLPGPLYWHQNIFFAEQAVVLPFVLVIFLEVIRDSLTDKDKKKIINLLQVCVFCWGTLTDWLMYIVIAILYLKRIYTGELGNNIKDFLTKSFCFWLPIIIILWLYLSQVAYFHTLDALKQRFLTRTGFLYGGWKVLLIPFQEYWFGHLKDWYGIDMVYLLFISLVFFLSGFIALFFIREVKVKKILLLMGISLLPCFLHICLLRHYAIHHSFTTLKFSIPVSIVIFVLLPLLFFYSLTDGINRDKLHYVLPVLAIIMLVCSFIYLPNEHLKYKDVFIQTDDYTIERFIAQHTTYKDVVFSPHYKISTIPPQQLSYSMKRVYQYQSPYEIVSFIASLKEDCIVNILLVHDKPINIDNFLKRIVEMSNDVVVGQKATLYKINRNTFTKLSY